VDFMGVNPAMPLYFFLSENFYDKKTAESIEVGISV